MILKQPQIGGRNGADNLLKQTNVSDVSCNFEVLQHKKIKVLINKKVAKLLSTVIMVNIIVDL